MYNQFGKKTNLIEKKRSEGRGNDNDNLVNDKFDLDKAVKVYYNPIKLEKLRERNRQLYDMPLQIILF